MHAFVYVEKISGGKINAVAETATAPKDSAVAEKNERIALKSAFVGYADAYAS